MAILNFVLICDGTSDLCLADCITWLMDIHFPDQSFRIVTARDLIPARGPLQDRLRKALYLYQPDIIFCHRDAERETLYTRISEIEDAASTLEICVIPVVPVRMTEAWLHFDESAIRAASGNKNGTAPLILLPLHKAEDSADPKAILLAALNVAKNHSSRRRHQFNEYQARSQITSHIDDFSPLRALTSFKKFEEDFLDSLNTHICAMA